LRPAERGDSMRIDLEEAIEFTVMSARTEPAMQGSDCFKSVEALRAVCDPTTPRVGVYGAASNRAAIRRYAETCEFQATPEDTAAELAELAAAGFPLPRRGCRNGACSLPAPKTTTN
jgi:hypothetical protein